MFCEQSGIQVWRISSDAPWQNGKTEVDGGKWKECFERVLTDAQPTNYEEYLTCVAATTAARGELSRVGGYSPNMLVFGREHRIPGNLM